MIIDTQDTTIIKPIDETFTTTKELDKLLDNSISIWFQKDVEPFDVKLLVKIIHKLVH